MGQSNCRSHVVEPVRAMNKGAVCEPVKEPVLGPVKGPEYGAVKGPVKAPIMGPIEGANRTAPVQLCLRAQAVGRLRIGGPQAVVD